MTRRVGLALLVTSALLMPLVFVPKGYAERKETPKVILSENVATEPAPLVQQSSAQRNELNPAVLKALGITRAPEKVSPETAGRRVVQKLTGNPDGQITMLPPSQPGSGAHIFKAPADAGKRSKNLGGNGGNTTNATSPVSLSASGLPAVLDPNGALSAALITNLSGRDAQFSEVELLADWDGREDMTADRSAKVDDFPAAPDFALTRAAISEHTVANGHPFFNNYYYGDTLSNFYWAIDVTGDPLVDITFQFNASELINTGTSGGFLLLNPTAGDCADPQVIITGIAVNPVADLGDFSTVAELCDTVGEVIYISVLETGSCASNGSGEPIRTRIFAFGIYEGSDAGGGFVAATNVRQIARTSVGNIGGLTVDDDGSLYFSLVDFASVDPVTGVGGLGGAIFKATEHPRTTCAASGRINRVIPLIPGLTGSTNTTLSQSFPISDSAVTLTNYSGTSSVFGNIASLTAGPNNVIYAAAAASNTGVSDPTQGLFRAPAAFPAGLPSMIITLADATGRFDTCSSPAAGLAGAIPIGDGIADPAGPGTSIRWRAFVLGNGPDIRTASLPLSNVTGTTDNTLKLDMQVDHTIYSGLAVNEEGTAFVISGGTPAVVGNSPSPLRTEILGFEDKQPTDRRADYVDFRGDNPPAPPASGGNVGDGDSDRFDHIFYQSPLDSVTLTPLGLAGLARGFLRYTNRLVGTNAAALPLGPGVTLGQKQSVQGDDDTTGSGGTAGGGGGGGVAAPVLFENLDPSHQVAGGDDQNSPFRGDDSDGLGTPVLAGLLNGGFEFSFGGPVGTADSIWNGFFLNSNGNITFGDGDTGNTPNVLAFRSGLPKIAPAWADLNPSARSGNPGSFPVQALGFANVNAFKIRYINVPQFNSETCTAEGGGASNTFSLTLYDDGTGSDENASQILDPADPTGDNVDPAFDLQEGPTDLRHLPSSVAGAPLVGEPPRPSGSGITVFDYGRMDLLGTELRPVLTGYSIGGLSILNPPGLCESNLSELARGSDTNPFGILAGNQTASILPGLIGEGTETQVNELFNSGVDQSIGSGGEIFLAKPDFDLRFEGNDLATSKPVDQVDQNRDHVGLFGTASGPPANPIIRQIIAVPGAFTPNAGTDLLDALGAVDVFVVGSGFFPNEVTTLCEGGVVPTDRPGKIVTTAMTFSVDNNGDSIPEATIALGNVTPISRNLVRARFVPLATASGTAFPFAAVGGTGNVIVTTTFTAGDNNVFGPFTRTAVGALSPGLRAPIVLGATRAAGACLVQDLTITGFNFTAAGPVTAVFAVEEGNPANVINATSFAILSNNIIDAIFNIGAANLDKRFLIFVTGPGGTSRNITPTLPPGTPAGVPLGNEQGNVIQSTCESGIAPDSLQFGSANLNVTEESTTVNATVTRLNPSAGTVTVDYSTSDGSATQKGDYEIASGTLTFGPGETTKTIPILINEDSYPEGTETFNLNLSNPTNGAAAGAPSTITILDDGDVSPPTTNPLDNSSDFVRQNYHDFLNRDADAPGLAFWVNEIESCAGNAACIDIKRQNVSAAFFLSIEFQETGGNVIRTQRVAFGKKSNEAATRTPYPQFMRDAQQVGRGVVVGQAGFEAVLEANKQAYAAQIVNSADFIARFSTSLNAADYVDALFASAGVVPTAGERNAAIGAFNSNGGGTAGRIAALRNAADSNSVRQAELNASFVLLQYYGYLRRNPTDAPDGNDDGYQFWLTKLNSFGGNFVQAEMVKAFLISGEYRQRFGP